MGTSWERFEDEPRAGSSILVGIDGRQGSARVLEAAARLALALDLPVVVALVQKFCSEVMPAGAEAHRELQEEIEESVFLTAAITLDTMGVRWQFGMARGEPARGLCELADACDAAIVVIGTRGDGARSKLHRLFNGSVSGRLVHGQHRPVLVVPPEPARKRRARLPSEP